MIGRMSSYQIHQSGLDVILDAQKRLSRTQEELASGKRLIRPSDDPIAASRVQNIQSELTRIQSMQNNINRASGELALAEGSVASAEDILMRARELAIRGSNSTMSAKDRELIAVEIDGLREQLLTVANTANSDGEFIFAGHAVANSPYLSGELNAKFVGDSEGREINISRDTRVELRLSGREIFGVGNANLIDVEGEEENSGLSSVTAVVSEDYNYEEVSPAYRLTYAEAAINVTNLDTGEVTTVVPDADNTFRIDGILFQVSEISVERAGDSFTLDPAIAAARGLNAFETLSVLSSGLRGANEEDTYFRFSEGSNIGAHVTHVGERVTAGNAISVALGAIDSSLELVREARTELGVRMNRVDDQLRLNENFNIRLRETLSDLEDLDYAEAITKMNLQMVALEAAQKAYTKTQGLSLFNYL